jgi:hypothetical protein
MPELRDGGSRAPGPEAETAGELLEERRVSEREVINDGAGAI